MANSPKLPIRRVASNGRVSDTYMPGDALPVPEVIEKDSDSVWALWSEAVKDNDYKDTETKYNETQPATLLMGLPELQKDRGA